MRVRSAPVALAPGVVTALWVVATASAAALWLVFYGLAFSGLQEARSQRQLYDAFRSRLAQETAPLGGAIPVDTPVALLTAPRVGLHKTVVVEGTSAKDLQLGPGHRADTVLPGQVGVSVVFGRSVTFGGPFGHITRFRVGDAIEATTQQGIFHYRVVGVRRAGDPLPPALATGGSRLTFVSSVGQGWRSGWAPTQAVYVDANLQGKAQPAPGGAPTSVPAVQNAMASDFGAQTPLLLWLEALLAVSVLVAWARVRWGGWHAWLAGGWLVLAVAWEVTQSAARLLPNLM